MTDALTEPLLYDLSSAERVAATKTAVPEGEVAMGTSDCPS